jgi:hypothetical protein
MARILGTTAHTRPPEETVMNPTIGYRLAQDHLADLRHQAERTALARTARRARRRRPRQPSHPRPALPVAARPALAVQSQCHHPLAPAGRTTVLGGSDV